MNEQANPTSLPASSFSAPQSPMTFGRIFDRILRLMRTHWRLFFGIAAVPATAVFLLIAATMSFLIRMSGPHLAEKSGLPPVIPTHFAMIFPIVELALVLVYALYMPAAIYAAAQANLGVTVTFRQAYRTAICHFGRYLWLMILCILYVVVPVAAIAALISGGFLLAHHAAATASGTGFPFYLIPLAILLYLCILVYAILIMLCFAVAYPASVEENLPAWAALRRSVHLTRGAKGRIFLVLLIIYAAVYAAQVVCMFVLFALAALGALGAMLTHVTEGSPAFFILVGLGVLGYLLMILVSVLLTYAALTTALAVLYHDQRLRLEGAVPAPIA